MPALHRTGVPRRRDRHVAPMASLRACTSPTCDRSRTSWTSNYVMHVWGSPLHAFDRSKLAGGRIVVRRARRGEELRTLDGTLRRLVPEDLMITDGEHSVALAAIMGRRSEVSEGTNELLLEAANFEPLGILRVERLGLRTAGSNRWEKGVDPYLAENAAVLASRMIVDLAGARMTGHVDVHDGLPERPVVRLRPERASFVIGLGVAPDEQRRPRGLRFRGLERLGRHRADLARARRDTRDRRDRGGRASSARPDPAHDAASPTRSRAPLEAAAAPPRRRRRPRRRGRLRGVHLEPRWVGSEPRRDSPSESDDVRPRGPSDDDRSRARRGGPHRESTRAPTTSRSSKSHASTCRRQTAPGRALARGRGRCGRLRRGQGRARDALRSPPPRASGRTRVAPSLHRARRPRPRQAGSASSIRPSSKEHGGVRARPGHPVRTRARADRLRGRAHVPAVLQDIAVAVAEDVEVGALVDAAHEAAGAYCGRRACSTSIAASRSVRDASP